MKKVVFKCLFCEKKFSIPVISNEDIKDHEGSTLDCPHCNETHVIINTKLKKFHEYLHSQDKRWPKDGKNTAYIDV